MYRVEVYLKTGSIQTYRNAQKPVLNVNDRMLTIRFFDISSVVHISSDVIGCYIVHKESESELIQKAKWHE